MNAAFLYFSNALWQVPVLVAAVWCALHVVRVSPRAQHLLWAATLVFAVLIPLRGTLRQPTANVEVTFSDTTPRFAAAAPHPRILPSFDLIITPQTRDLLAGLYLLLTAFCALRLAFSYRALRSLVAASTPALLSPTQQARLDTLTHQLETPVCTVRILPPHEQSPLVAGLRHPTLLLPAWLLDEPEDALATVLAHELAHLVRHDPASSLALRLLALPIAFHPATTILHRRLRHTREMHCDALAAAALPSPSLYARTLLTLARQLVGPAPDTALGLFQTSSQPLLEERIMNLVQSPAPLRRGPRALRLAAAATVVTAATALVATLHFTPTVLAAQLSSPATPGTQPKPSAATVPETAPRPASTLQPGSTTPQGQLTQGAAEQGRATAAISDPAVGKQIAAVAQAEVDNADVQKQLAAVQQQLNSPEFKKQIHDALAEALSARSLNDQIRRELNSTALKEQLRQAQAEAVKATRESAAVRQSMADLQKQFNSPEFHQQIAQATRDANASLNTFNVATPPQQGPSRVSAAVMAGSIVTKVQPIYPPEAKAAGITGAVVLHAIIGRDGTMQSLTVVSGPPELVTSAMEAVRQWVYKPYMLNGEATEVDTTVTVNYSMG